MKRRCLKYSTIAMLITRLLLINGATTMLLAYRKKWRIPHTFLPLWDTATVWALGMPGHILLDPFTYSQCSLPLHNVHCLFNIINFVFPKLVKFSDSDWWLMISSLPYAISMWNHMMGSHVDARTNFTTVDFRRHLEIEAACESNDVGFR